MGMGAAGASGVKGARGAVGVGGTSRTCDERSVPGAADERRGGARGLGVSERAGALAGWLEGASEVAGSETAVTSEDCWNADGWRVTGSGGPRNQLQPEMGRSSDAAVKETASWRRRAGGRMFMGAGMVRRGT